MPFNVTRLTILAGCFRGFAYCSGRRLVYTEEGWRCRTGPFKAVDSWDYMNYPERLVQMFLILRRTAGMIVAVLRKAWKTPIGATFFVSWCFGWLRWLFRSKDFFHLFFHFFLQLFDDPTPATALRFKCLCHLRLTRRKRCRPGITYRSDWTCATCIKL